MWWISILISIVVVSLCIGIYYAIYRKLPGARVIEQDIPMANTLEPNQTKFMFFYTSWCPWCKKAQQPWSSLKQIMKNSKYTYGGKTVTFEDINAESDKGKAALYKIQAYPTFKLETDSKVYEMVGGKPSVDGFRAFLTKALGPEKISQNGS